MTPHYLPASHQEQQQPAANGAAHGAAGAALDYRSAMPQASAGRHQYQAAPSASEFTLRHSGGTSSRGRGYRQ